MGRWVMGQCMLTHDPPFNARHVITPERNMLFPETFIHSLIAYSFVTHADRLQHQHVISLTTIMRLNYIKG